MMRVAMYSRRTAERTEADNRRAAIRQEAAMTAALDQRLGRGTWEVVADLADTVNASTVCLPLATLPGRASLLALVETGGVDVIVIPEMNGLMPSRRSAVEVMDALRERNVSLIDASTVRFGRRSNAAGHR